MVVHNPKVGSSSLPPLPHISSVFKELLQGAAVYQVAAFGEMTRK